MPNPPNPQISSSVQVVVTELAAVLESFKHLKGVLVISGMSRMQAVNLAPRLINISDEGPIM